MAKGSGRDMAGDGSGGAAAVASSEHRFRLLVRAVRDYAIYMLDPEGRVVSWNDGAARIKGYTEAEVLGRSFAIFHTPEDRAAGHPEEALEIAVRDGVFSEERWRVRRDGTRFWAHVTLTALYDDGELVGFAKVTRDLTERRRAEETLRESEERFRQLAGNAREVFWLATAEWNEILYVSPAFERVWGHPTEALIADPRLWLRSVHPDDAPAVEAAAARLTQERADFHFRIIRPDGEVRWLLTRGFPVRDAAGDVLRIGGVTEDVTEERESAERLHFLAEAGRELTSSLEYEETLRTVSRLAVPRVADWCVVDVLEEGAIRRLSVAHTDPAKEAMAWEVARRYPPEMGATGGVAEVLRTGERQVLREIPDEVLRRVARDEEHYRMITELGLRSSITLPMRARGRTLGAITFIRAESGRRYEEGDVAFAEELAARAALAVDNARLFREAHEARGEAERRAAQEEALRRAAQAVTAALDVDDVLREIAVNALHATNADGAFVKRIDAAAGQVVVAARAGSIAPPLGARGALDGSFTKLAVESGKPLLVPTLADVQGSVITAVRQSCDDCSVMIVPLTAARDAIGSLVLARLPERQGFRPDEMERATTFADLASLALRRIHLLRESEARRSELEEATESRARLIRGFTHDLKNPLGAADGYLQMIEMGVVTDPDRQELGIGRARRAIRAALDLINDLSQLAQAEAGRIDVARQPVDVGDIAAEVTEEYRAQAEAKGLALHCRLPQRLPVIRSDATRIRQILGNLLSNAVKYTREGEVTVTVRVQHGRKTPSGGHWLTVQVADTGVGIPRAKQHLLFREFSRIDPGSAPGVGLGLAISQRIAHALSGCITVSSRSGRGSTFTLWLPLPASR